MTQKWRDGIKNQRNRLQIGGERRCSGNVASACSTRGTRRVTSTMFKTNATPRMFKVTVYIIIKYINTTVDKTYVLKRIQ